MSPSCGHIILAEMSTCRYEKVHYYIYRTLKMYFNDYHFTISKYIYIYFFRQFIYYINFNPIDTMSRHISYDIGMACNSH